MLDEFGIMAGMLLAFDGSGISRIDLCFDESLAIFDVHDLGLW